MRRSKSNPAKYAKNYKKISQRRMIDDSDEASTFIIASLREQLEATTNQIAHASSADDGLDSSSGAPDESNNISTILSAELLEENGDYCADSTPLIVPDKQKKHNNRKRPLAVALTPSEIKAARKKQKALQRKLQSLERKQEQKNTRQLLYQKLQQSQLSNVSLLQSSARLGQSLTKKQKLQTYLHMERSGLELSEAQKELLYRHHSVRQTDHENVHDDTGKNLHDEDEDQEEPPKTTTHAERIVQRKANTETKSRVAPRSEPTVQSEPPKQQQAATSSSLAVKMMMASLSTLKQTTDSMAVQVESSKSLSLSDLATTSKKAYIPSAPIEIKTTQSYEPTTKQQPLTAAETTRIRHVERPPDLQAVRTALPIFAMEFEVMDVIRNNDVTIICAETGSGKSTQIPQLLYEHCVDHGKLIGITQPRRVAAISTAKRVCYELNGSGNKGCIPSNSIVGYQTRYERAGLGSRTQIKFMTDGILLKEIQTDLLLRQYNVLVIDEAHERNLNTDVLIGLISTTIELRKEAAAQEDTTIQPLKVIIMSATLRIQDFSDPGKRLFEMAKVGVVQVPGRTHPVTIHHARVTELDQYEDAAFKKTCRIHRQLPKGGILVFLTGKQEIIRMVNRLRKALCHQQSVVAEARDQSVDFHDDFEVFPRDMDDDEIDGDIFQPDDLDTDVATKTDVADSTAPARESNIPEKVIILPLYSLLSTQEQAKAFAPVPEGHRLIVVSTNIAETSITIPGIAYVVDAGRQKARNYNAETGVASFDIMWISKASANQRAGRAGRTGPGHCYRLYSSSLYSRHMDDYALPEILTRPLEDVVLAMKAMKISNIANFPFPTPPDASQVNAAVRLLADIGCVDISNVGRNGGDGVITRLGAAVSKLPLGVRYGKMLLVAAEAGVLDYAIVVVAALSETDPFVRAGQKISTSGTDDDKSESEEQENESNNNSKGLPKRWTHKGGDVLAAMLAVGAYTYAGRGAGGACEALACRKFCEENGLHYVVMQRIQKMRTHLARLAKVRLRSVDSVASKTGGFVSSMRPPDALQEMILRQAIASGLLDNVAMLAPVGSIAGNHPYSLRTAYLGCSSNSMEPLFMDRNSVLFSRDSRVLPRWICYETLMRKTLKDGTPIAVMKNCTPIDASWLCHLAKNSRLLSIGEPLPSPMPVYDTKLDAVLCTVKTKFGSQGWEIPPMQVEMFDALERSKESPLFSKDDSFRWFARFLFEGQVLPELSGVSDMLNDSPAIITRKSLTAKVALVASALATVGIDSATALRKHWACTDDKFLFNVMKKWVKQDRITDFKKLWITAVRKNVEQYRQEDKTAQ